MRNVKRCVVLLICLYGYAEALSGPGPLCLSCDKVVRPRDCTHVTLCGEHEKCAVETYLSTSGIQFYKVGCRATKLCDTHRIKRSTSADVMVCLECCNDENLCNRKGCGETEFPMNGGKICYKCDQHLNPDTCDDITLCGSDQSCYISDISIITDKLYTSGCKSKVMCNYSHGNNTCSHCCDTPLCNDNCNQTMSTNTKYVASTVPQAGAPGIQQTTTSAGVSGSQTLTVQTSPTAAPTPSCPGDHWYIYKNSKYCLYDTLASWNTASNICKNHSTHLPIVESYEELHFIDTIIRSHNSDIWLDGTDEAVEGHWVWNTTGKAISTFMWEFGQPDNYYGQHSENCLEYGYTYRYKWNDAPCFREVPVLCELSIESTVTDPIPDCSSGWKIEQSMMFCDVLRRVNWYDAKTECQKLGAHLPIIDSAEKQSLLNRLVGQNEIWIDGTQEGHISHWKWSSSGQDIGYTNWLPGEPNNYFNLHENCIEYGNVYHMQWNDRNCGDPGRTTKIICERTVPNIVVG